MKHDTSVRGVSRLALLSLPLLIAGSYSLHKIIRGASTPLAVTTAAYNNSRTNANTAETVLKPQDLSRLQRVASYSLDGATYGSPLYIPGVSVPKVGIRNVVIMATMNDSVYALDADAPGTSPPLWVTRFSSPPTTTPVQASAVQQSGAQDYAGPIGIVSTPVYNPANGAVYVVERTVVRGGYHTHLAAIRTQDGSVAGSLELQAKAPGGGPDSANGYITFNSRTQNQRPALLLVNGMIYIAFGSHTDMTPSHGWVMGVRASDLRPISSWLSTQHGSEMLGSIWNRNGLASYDAEQAIFGSTGNGAVGVQDFAQSVFRLNSTTGLQAFHRPPDYDYLNLHDQDFAAGGVVLVPGTNMVVAVGKSAEVLVLDREHLENAPIQRFTVSDSLVFNSPVVWWRVTADPLMFISGSGDVIRSYRWSSSANQFVPYHTSPDKADLFPGAPATLSSNGDLDGILWASVPYAGDGGRNYGAIVAYDAETMQPVWSSAGVLPPAVPSVQSLRGLGKFVPPMVANGKLFAVTGSGLDIYALR